MIRFRFFFLFLFIFSIAEAQTTAQNVQHAQDLIEKGKIKQAKKFLDKCIKSEVNNAQYFFWRGQCFWMMGDRTEAIGDETWAVKLAPDSIRFRMVRASYFFYSAQFDKADIDYKHALQMARTKSDSVTIFGCEGQVMVILGDTAGGVAMLEKCLSMDSMNYFGLVNYAMVLNDMGKSADALPKLFRALSKDSANPVILSNIGFCYSTMGEYQKAIPYFDRCISINSHDAIAWNNRGYCKLKTGDLPGAMSDVQHSLKLFPQNSYAYRNLGLIYLAKGDSLNACKAFDDAIAYGFTQTYGSEVKELQRKNCR